MANVVFTTMIVGFVITNATFITCAWIYNRRLAAFENDLREAIRESFTTQEVA